MRKIRIVLKEDNLKIRNYLQQNLQNEFSNIDIKFIDQIGGNDLYNLIMKMNMEEPLDIFPTYLPYLKNFLEKNLLLEMKPYLKELDFIATGNKASFVGYDYNKAYSIPYVPYHVALVYYNPEIFKQCNIKTTPKTFEEFCNVCEVLLNNNYLPLAISFTEHWHMALLILTLMGNDNPFIIQEIINKKKSFDNPSIIQAIDKLKYLIEKKYINFSQSNRNYSENLELFFQNKAAMVMDMSSTHINKAIRMFDNSNYFFLPGDDRFHYGHFAVTDANKYSFLAIFKNETDPLLKCKIALRISELYGKFCFTHGDYRPQIFNPIKKGWIRKTKQPYLGVDELVSDGNLIKYIDYIDNSQFKKDILIETIYKNITKDSKKIAKILATKELVKISEEKTKDYLKTTYYEDNKIVSTPNFEKGIIAISKFKNYDQLTNYPHGYQFIIPQNMKIDLSLATCGVKLEKKDLNIRINYEKTNYDTDYFIDEYVYKYYRNDNYLRVNNFSVIEDVKYYYDGRKIDYVCVRHTPVRTNYTDLNYYIYATITLDKLSFITILIRTNNYLANINTIKTFLHSLNIISQKGVLVDTKQYNFEMPMMWNKETKDFYNNLKAKKDVDWGMFHPQSHNNYHHIQKIEEAINYKFPVVMYYEGVQYDLPVEALNKAYNERNQYVVFTLHVCEGANEDTFGKNYCFEMIEGLWDDKFRKWAREIKAFKKPIIIRMSNEMNTDWTKYAGPLLMSDPNNFIKLWKRIYDIFIEEMVDNAIFAINGYDRDYPPLSWNKSVAYFPGSEYCQLIGLTGYNVGEYKSYENWRDFKEIYEPLVKQTRQYFKDYCWIFGEFGSSSCGGDKSQWIRDCFAYFQHIPELKVAIWFNYADYDGNYERNNIAARSFWLDESIEYLETFANCLKKIK